MKALVYTSPNEVTFRDEPEPSAAPGEVMLGIDAVGICGSDMHAYYGRDPRRNPPLILGHELCGTIVAGLEAGKRVTVNPLITCGRCDYCRDGREHGGCTLTEMAGLARLNGMKAETDLPQRGKSN